MKDQEISWLYDYLYNQLSEEEFVSLLEFPWKKNPYLTKDVKALLAARSQNVVCEYEKGRNRFEIEIKEKVELFNDALAGKSQKEFNNTILNTIAEIYIGSEFCPGLKSLDVKIKDYVTQRTEHHSLNFFTVLTRTSQFLSNSKYYDLVQFIHLANIKEFETDKFHLLN